MTEEQRLEFSILTEALRVVSGVQGEAPLLGKIAQRMKALIPNPLVPPESIGWLNGSEE